MKETLDEVKDREDRCHIVEKELITQRDLSQDRLKAENTKSYEPNQQKACGKRC